MSEIKKQKVAAPQLKAFEQELRLRWVVEYFLVEGLSGICRINSDAITKTHEVWLHEGVMRNFTLFLPDLTHELCHGALAEQIDPIFAGVVFGPQSDRLSRQNPGKFVDLYRRVESARNHEDIWVNDLRHRHWPQITQQDKESFFLSLNLLVKERQKKTVSQLVMLIGLAQQLAEIERHNLEPVDIKPVRNLLGKRVWRDVLTLSEFFKSLPRLQYDREQDLKTYENFLQQSCQMLGFDDLKPYLVEVGGRMLLEVI